jgi:NAD(P)-dependent dehydrogenase (short-subunit alcohol dehydrogenase family)
MAAKKPQSLKKAQPAQVGASRLAGEVAVITGGSRGIGYAVAKALAAEGCDIVLSARDAAVLKKSAARLARELRRPPAIVPIACDVRDPQSVSALFDEVRQRFGRIDVLFNNAGISQSATPLAETSLEMWRELIDTNLTGVYLCSRAALPLMSRGASIVNNLSAAAKQIFPNYYGYTAAKTGAYGFTLTLRQELMPRGIRVTALMPGATDTDIWQQIMPDAPRGHMMKVESIAQAVLYAVLLPPNVNPSEISLDPVGGAV